MANVADIFGSPYADETSEQYVARVYRELETEQVWSSIRETNGVGRVHMAKESSDMKRRMELELAEVFTNIDLEAALKSSKAAILK